MFSSTLNQKRQQEIWARLPHCRASVTVFIKMRERHKTTTNTPVHTTKAKTYNTTRRYNNKKGVPLASPQLAHSAVKTAEKTHKTLSHHASSPCFITASSFAAAKGRLGAKLLGYFLLASCLLADLK